MLKYKQDTTNNVKIQDTRYNKQIYIKRQRNAKPLPQQGYILWLW